MRRLPWFLISPSLLLVQQSVTYALVGASCHNQTTLPLHAVIGFTALVIAFGMLDGWRDWRAHRVEVEDDAQRGPAPARHDFVALLNGLVSGIALLVVIVQWIAVFVLSPCQ
jgi:hypothetical protein